MGLAERTPRPLPAMAQMVEDVLDRNALQIERDAHAPSCSGTEVAMQAHCSGLHLIRHSGDRADSGVLSGWCDPLAGLGHRLAEHREVADVVRQQKNQLGVDEPALLRREVAMDLDQGFVEAVRSAIFGSVFSMASSCMTSGARQGGSNRVNVDTPPARAQTCWSGRSR